MKERDAYFDNLKFILILLVVVGHLIEPFNGEPTMGTIYQFIYSFHMPLFIFTAGYFAKRVQSPKQYVGLLSGLVVPYFIFETLYTLFDYYMQGLDRLDFTYFYPNWILWFLFSMMLWKMLLPYLLMLKYPLVFCFAMSIMLGYSIDVDYYASISRTLYFLPFFSSDMFSKGNGWMPSRSGPSSCYRSSCSPPDLSCCTSYRLSCQLTGSTGRCLTWSLAWIRGMQASTV